MHMQTVRISYPDVLQTALDARLSHDMTLDNNHDTYYDPDP